MKKRSLGKNTKILIGLSALVLIGLASLPVGADTTPASTESATAPTIEDLGWLAGCWASIGRDPGSGEQWMQPAGGSMVGVSRMVRGDRTVAWEMLRIHQTEDSLVYVALPSGQAETAFPLKSLTSVEGSPSVVFENPEHDFPQRIRYQLAADGRLAAGIEGEMQGQQRSMDFSMRKVDCEAPLAAGEEEP